MQCENKGSCEVVHLLHERTNRLEDKQEKWFLKIDSKIEKLSNFQYKIIGAGLALSALITVAFQVVKL